MRRALIPLVLLAACSPTDMVDKIGRRTAETVVLPVVARYLPGPQADIATRCIIDNASAADIQALARDVGVEAGSSTIARVLSIASTPQAASCMASAGIGRLGG